MNNEVKVLEASDTPMSEEEERKLGRFRKGDLVIVRWTDASDQKGAIEDHLGNPGVLCKDWGIYLGVTGRKRRFLLIGKDVVEVHNRWGATRIPLELVEEVTVLLSRGSVVEDIREVQVLGRRVTLRRGRREDSYVRVA